MSAAPQVLVAGIGNIFFGDDGFGVEVARRLAAIELPPSVRVSDFGIRGLHLALEMLEREYDTTIFVDAVQHGVRPGTVSLIEPDAASSSDPLDAHGMTPATVLSTLAALGGAGGRILIVGCEPERIDEGIGLSPAVAGAVDRAVRLVLEQVHAAVHEQKGS